MIRGSDALDAMQEYADQYEESKKNSKKKQIMEILTVKANGKTISIGDMIKVRHYQIKTDDKGDEYEDTENPIEEFVTIKSFEPTDDCLKMNCIDQNGNDNYFFEDNLI